MGAIPRIPLGIYPTAVEPVPSLSTAKTALWVKRDDKSAVIYGGNKVRKLEYMFGVARARGKTHLLTAGSAGSHHVLATAAFGAREGFKVTAALVPQVGSPYARDVLRAALAQGLVGIPVKSYVRVPLVLAPLRGRDAYFVALGGSSALGTLPYVDAARELAAQVRAGFMPEPDVVYVTFGTGGTAAGIALGLVLEGLKTRVVGVSIVEPPALFARMGRQMVKGAAKLLGVARADVTEALARLTIDTAELGRGYAHPTAAGQTAIVRAAAAGLEVDATYTAKTFAAVLARIALGDLKTLLYWHTLSTVPLAPLMVGAPPLEPRFAELLA
jgi:1-aminocyclopropane-1-carboxylate deaminase/D-cysteine desulfhydrase-like pyridoxal-dependent ACC family enzyme